MVRETLLQDFSLSRRRLLAGAVALGLGGAVLRGGAIPARAAPQGPKHLVWVWQFTTDAEPNLVGERLLAHNLGIVLKTHDGLQWMSDYDKSAYAVSGPAQVGVLAHYYETAGVPFHAWAVIKGIDPVREARMAAEVLGAGARSIFLDIEPFSGFWVGTPADAEAFGRELRRLQPNGHVVLAIDARPWVLERLPMKEFAAFANEIAPQQYWRTFNTQANYDRFNQTGFPVGPEGVTPEFIFNVANQVLAPFGLPISHIGQGATPDVKEWQRFVDLSFGAGMNTLSVWRYGVTAPDVFTLLRDMPPPVPLVLTGAGGAVYVVQSGDTLGGIAAAHGVSVDAIMQANSLSDPNYIYEGQELTIPGSGGNVPVVAAQVNAGSRTYTVVAGDTLYGIAGRFGTTVDAIVQANGLSDANVLSIGQELKIP
jgi:LysM repeat protein